MKFLGRKNNLCGNKEAGLSLSFSSPLPILLSPLPPKKRFLHTQAQVSIVLIECERENKNVPCRKIQFGSTAVRRGTFTTGVKETGPEKKNENEGEKCKDAESCSFIVFRPYKIDKELG